MQQEETVDLMQTTAIFKKEITEENRYYESERYVLSGRGQIDHGDKARAFLARMEGK